MLFTYVNYFFSFSLWYDEDDNMYLEGAGKFTNILLFFFRFAWTAKVDLPILITIICIGSQQLDIIEVVDDWPAPMVSEEAGRATNILLFFFRFAWLSKIRLPTILTVVFLAFDIRVRLEMEVNI